MKQNPKKQTASTRSGILEHLKIIQLLLSVHLSTFGRPVYLLVARKTLLASEYLPPSTLTELRHNLSCSLQGPIAR